MYFIVKFIAILIFFKIFKSFEKYNFNINILEKVFVLS